MTDKTYRPADITPGMVALLWDMPGFALLDVFKELVKRHDIDSLQVVLGSDTLQKHPWADLPFHLLPLKDSEDPRARNLYASWSQKMSGTDPKKMAHRLLYLVGTNDRDPKIRGPLLEEIGQLMSLGGDIEDPIGASKRTALGEAIKSISFHAAQYMIAEFAKRNPDRLPLAAKGKDILSFLISNNLNDFSTDELFVTVAKNYDFSSAALRVPASKAVAKIASSKDGKPSSNDAFMNLLTLVEHRMINAEAMHSLWNMVGTDQFDREAAFFLSVTKVSGTRSEAKALAAFEKFLEAGIDINAPLPDGRRPVEHAIAFGSEGFFVRVLESGVDLRSLKVQIESEPDKFAKALPERVAMVSAMLARQQVMNVVNTIRRPQPG